MSAAPVPAALESDPPPRIVDVVFAGRLDHPLGRSVLALAVALSIHLGALAWTTVSGPSLAEWSAQLAAHLHEELARERVVELTPAPPPPKPPPPAAPPPPRAPVARAARPTQRRADARPPPPAQAGRIIAQEEGPRAPLDLTGDTFVTGTALAYAGGVTSPTGTNPNPVEAREVDPKAPVPPAEPDLSRRVVLVEEGCHNWPPEAEAEPVDHKDVTLRIVVRPDGSVASARLVSNPGRAFGDAAVGCARRSRFDPQLDAAGRPVQAELRFTWHFTR